MSDDKDQVYDDASKVAAKDGVVKVEGPDAVDVNLSPEAALETGDRLAEDGVRAAGQRRMKDQPHKSS